MLIIKMIKTTKKTTVSGLSNDLKAWWFKRNNETFHEAQSEINLSKYDAYLGNTNRKKIYLTFDEGYEYVYK